MSLGNRHRRWGKGRGRNRPRSSSLTQQTHKNRRGSQSHTGRVQQYSNLDSRTSSDESFGCMGEVSPVYFELKAAPKRNPKLRPTSQQRHGDTPAAMELERAAEAETQSEIASMMERIRFLKVVAEMEKVFQSPSADLDHSTYLDGHITKDGESFRGTDSITGVFFPPLPYHDSTNCESNVDGACKLHEPPKSTRHEETEQLHFNVDIFKKPASGTSGYGGAQGSTQGSRDVQEELHAERWEYLQQLERRATEASLEGLRKASLKADTERSQSISSSGHNTTSSSGSRKFSFSRQRRVGSDKSQRSDSIIRNRFVSNDCSKVERKNSNSTKFNPAITLTHPPERYPTSQKDKLLLRSPSVEVMPILQEISSPALSRESSLHPLGPRPMSNISNLSNMSNSSNQGNEKEILLPLIAHFDSTLSIDPKETQVISIPTSAIKQMVRTSKYLINRKNSANYPSPLNSSFNNWNYQDQMNSDLSTDELAHPSLIEITLNKVDTYQGKVTPTAKEEVEEILEAKIPERNLNSGVESVILSDGSVEASRGNSTYNRFRRLSIGDDRAVPRNKRYKYMKTHPPLPACGPCPDLPQLNIKQMEARQEVIRAQPRLRSASLGTVIPAHKEIKSCLRSPSKIKALPSSKLHQDPDENFSMDRMSTGCKQLNLEPWGHFGNSSPNEKFSPQQNQAPASLNPTIKHKKKLIPKGADDYSSLNKSNKIYKYSGGVKSQSEPSLRFISSSSLSIFGSQRSDNNNHRKLKKRSRVFSQKNAPAVPPLPAIFQTEDHHSQASEKVLPPPFEPHPSSLPKNKSFFSNLKLFCKSFLPHHTRLGGNPLIASEKKTYI